ncbi:MAG: helix-turn-helix domain-containing protein [Alphaproteobacteria bacterium]
MSKRLYPHNRIRYWDVYGIDDVCAVFNMHPQTVRKWIKNGLKTIDNGKPSLIYGNDLIVFLKKKNTKNKCETAFHELFCLKCQDARPIYQNKIAVTQKTQILNVCGVCRTCKAKMYQSYKLNDFPNLRKIFQVVDVLELYDCEASSDKTHIHADKHKQENESDEWVLF